MTRQQKAWELRSYCYGLLLLLGPEASICTHKYTHIFIWSQKFESVQHIPGRRPVGRFWRGDARDFSTGQASSVLRIFLDLRCMKSPEVTSRKCYDSPNKERRRVCFCEYLLPSALHYHHYCGVDGEIPRTDSVLSRYEDRDPALICGNQGSIIESRDPIAKSSIEGVAGLAA